MAYNLMEEAWLHVEYGDGFRRWVAPWQIAEETGHGLPARFCSGRPDLDGAMIEFSIGLIQTVFCPARRQDWWNLWSNPPDAVMVKERLTVHDVKSCFELLGEGHCFMQDEDLLADADPVHIEALLIDAAGAQTTKRNTDHFVKRGRVRGMCRRCAAQALFCLQSYAPSGGKGNRVSLRGGGPLTTIVVGGNLFETAILNTTEFPVPQRLSPQVLPWMGPARTSEKNTGCITTPDDVHPLQAFWGMPRRIRLNEADCEGACEVCGATGQRLIQDYRARPYGINYEGGWCHPLSPHRIQNNVPISIHAQPGGIRYKSWLGAIVPDNAGSLVPARTVMRCSDRLISNNIRPAGSSEFRVSAFGYDMDNMKARCWYEGEFPVHRVSEDIRDAFECVSASLVFIADLGATSLREAIFSARDPEGHKTKSSNGEFSQIGAFWSGTEADFYKMVNRARCRLSEGEAATDVFPDWLTVIRRSALQLFDSAADVVRLADHGNPRAVVKAREGLVKALSWTKSWRERLGVVEEQDEGRDAG